MRIGNRVEFLTLKLSQTTVKPPDFIHSWNYVTLFVMVLFYVSSTAIFSTKKSRVIKFWGFFMYLLFLGIAQTNETWQRSVSKKVSCALGNLLWRDTCFLCFLPKGRSIENGIAGLQNSLQMRKFKDSKLELFILSLFYIVPNLGTPSLGRDFLRKTTNRRRCWAVSAVFGLFSSLFLTSSAFHCFKGEF